MNSVLNVSRLAAAIAVCAGTLTATSGIAATITNSDGKEQLVTTTIEGVRSELTIAAGAQVTVCESGCFILFPSGDLLPLTGNESVVIQNGAGRVVSN